MKTDSKDPRIARAAIAIVNYLRDHPDAEDTAAGIAQWWVGEAYEIVEKALCLLVSQSIIERTGKVYRLNQQEDFIDVPSRIDA